MSIERAAIGSPQNAPQTDKDDRLHMVYMVYGATNKAPMGKQDN